MLKNNLKDISNIVLLRSDKILNELLMQDLYTHSINNTSNSYLNGVRDYYPNAFRKGAIQNSIKHTLEKNNAKDFSLDYEFGFLDDLFDYYLKFDGNHIYAKKEFLQGYSSLISKVHPFNIIGYKLAKKYSENKTTLQNIKEYAKYITPLGLNVNRDYKEYAENHIHLGGSNTEALNFVALLSNPTDKKFYSNEILDTLPRINEFSYINNAHYSFGTLIDIAKYCVSAINSFVLFDKSDRDVMGDVYKLANYGKNSMVEIDFCSFEMLEKLSATSGMMIKNEFLKETINYKKDGYANKLWFIYNILLFDLHLSSATNNEIKKVVKILLHISNILRSYMVMSQNIGLSHFSEFFGSTLRKQERNRFQNVASNIISNGTTKVEAKIAPDAIFDDEMIRYKLAFDKEIIKRESSHIKETYQKYFLDTNHSKRNYHFCVHFIRSEDKSSRNNDSGLLPIRFYKLRKELKKQAIKLNNFLYKESQIISKIDFYRKFYTDEIKVLQHEDCLKDEYIDLSKLITTIDVAGDENRTPSEVFAPIIKYLRRDIKKLDDFRDDYIKYQRDGHDFVENYRLRLSVHAGEDFNHIVTGMRKVHETVKFYHMGERDRLGHALAIGLNPKKWAQKNLDIFVTKQEHLDNLVWLYHQANEIDGYFKFTDRLKSKYEKIALELFKEIYGNEIQTTLNDIYKAWKLREYCPDVMWSDNDFAKRDEYIEPNLFDEKKEQYYKVAKDIYRKYHTCEGVRNYGNEVIKIEYDNVNTDGYHKYFITDDDLDLIEAVQDRLIQKFCEKGIIIETNPSSNVYIAHIDSYDEHPIYRWYPVQESDLNEGSQINKYGLRKSRMKVCVNTDDPAIMPTTLRNEFSLLEFYGKAHCQSNEAVEKWSEDLRQVGLEIFNYDHQKSEFRRV
ncbi:MAG: hypothetical protein NTZ60_01920 [Campylobacterales bacterium]|nr:hypothetical protein [Campylobacterales bacterium]